MFHRRTSGSERKHAELLFPLLYHLRKALLLQPAAERALTA